MPEELRDLMDRATEGPVSRVDADDVWKRGSRERRMRRVFYAAPIVVLLALVAGLAVMAVDNSSEDSDDTTVADLTPEQQSVVDEYLGVLEERGVLADFPDERAAVEYARRVYCFGIVAPEQLDALGAATTDVVNALTAEGVVSAAWYYELAPEADLTMARTNTDAAIEAWQGVAADVPHSEPAGAVNQGTVWDTALTRLDDLPTIRQAIDDFQMAGVNAAEQLNATTEALLAVLDDAASLTSDPSTFREWDRQVLLLTSELTLVPTTFIAVGAAEGIGPDIDQLEEDPQNYDSTFSMLGGPLSTADDAIGQWDDGATSELKSLLRNATSTEDVRDYEALLEEILTDLQQARPSGVDPAELIAATEDKRAALVSVASAAAELATTGESAITDVDAVVSDACDATEDAILEIEPAAVER